MTFDARKTTTAREKEIRSGETQWQAGSRKKTGGQMTWPLFEEVSTVDVEFVKFLQVNFPLMPLPKLR